MLESSKDILWIALAFAILWVGIFVGWGAFYLAMMLRDFYKITSGVRKKLELVDDILKSIREKTAKTAAIMPIIKGAGKIVEHIMDKRKKEKKKDKEK